MPDSGDWQSVPSDFIAKQGTASKRRDLKLGVTCCENGPRQGLGTNNYNDQVAEIALLGLERRPVPRRHDRDGAPGLREAKRGLSVAVILPASWTKGPHLT